MSRLRRATFLFSKINLKLKEGAWGLTSLSDLLLPLLMLICLNELDLFVMLACADASTVGTILNTITYIFVYPLNGDCTSIVVCTCVVCRWQTANLIVIPWRS